MCRLSSAHSGDFAASDARGSSAFLFVLFTVFCFNSTKSVGLAPFLFASFRFDLVTRNLTEGNKGNEDIPSRVDRRDVPGASGSHDQRKRVPLPKMESQQRFATTFQPRILEEIQQELAGSVDLSDHNHLQEAFHRAVQDVLQDRRVKDGMGQMKTELEKLLSDPTFRDAFKAQLSKMPVKQVKVTETTFQKPKQP